MLTLPEIKQRLLRGVLLVVVHTQQNVAAQREEVTVFPFLDRGILCARFGKNPHLCDAFGGVLREVLTCFRGGQLLKNKKQINRDTATYTPFCVSIALESGYSLYSHLSWFV